MEWKRRREIEQLQLQMNCLILLIRTKRINLQNFWQRRENHHRLLFKLVCRAIDAWMGWEEIDKVQVQQLAVFFFFGHWQTILIFPRCIFTGSQKLATILGLYVQCTRFSFFFVRENTCVYSKNPLKFYDNNDLWCTNNSQYNGNRKRQIRAIQVSKNTPIPFDCHMFGSDGWLARAISFVGHTHRYTKVQQTMRHIVHWSPNISRHCESASHESIMHCMHLSVILLCRLQPIDCVCIILSVMWVFFFC